jgi:TatD DNase family protein
MLIDGHAHLDGYDELGPSALDRALGEIARLRVFTIANSMDVPSYRRNLEIAERSPWVLPAFGVHPWNAHRYAGRRDELAEPMARSPLFGEIGLDRFFVKDESRYPAQQEIFELFLGAAKEQGKVVIVHVKGAEREALETLDRYELPGVVIHWYSGPLGIFREMLKRRFYFTVGSEVMRLEKIRRIACGIPADRLLTETDNPGGPQSVFGRPGYPSILPDIIRVLAKVRGVAAEELAATIRANLAGLFKNNPKLTGFLENVSPREP